MKAGLICLLALAGAAPLIAADPAEPERDTILLTFAGRVEVAPAGTTNWAPGQTNQTLKLGDLLRTGKNSRASLRLSDLSVLRVYELTTLEIKPPAAPKANDVIDIKAGATYFFNRDKPQVTQFQTPSASGAIRGTEFLVQVEDDGTTRVSLFNGEVDLRSDSGALTIKSGEQAVAAPGRPPARTAAIVSAGLIQWCLYYPGVLRPGDLDLGGAENVLRDSLRAYHSGDLIGALAAWPPDRTPATDAERVYRAALLLSVGNINDSRRLLEGISSNAPAAGGGVSPWRLAQALQRMIAAVTFQNAANFPVAATNDFSATEWLVESYCPPIPVPSGGSAGGGAARGGESAGFCLRLGTGGGNGIQFRPGRARAHGPGGKFAAGARQRARGGPARLSPGRPKQNPAGRRRV